MIGILLFGLFIAIIWYKYIKPFSYWQDKGVKQTKPLPVFGDSWLNLFKQMSNSEFMQMLYNMYPNERYMGCYQFSKPTLVVRDPELIKQLTVKDFEHFTDHRPIPGIEADPLSAGVLFLLNGEKWREMRATLSGTFTSSKMKSIFHLIEDTAENFVNYFSNKNEEIIELEMKDVFSRFTNDVIATAAFGIQCDSLNKPNNEFYLVGKKLTNFGNLKSMFVMIGYTILPTIFKLLKIIRLDSKVINFIRDTITENIKVRQEKGIVRPDMINILLEARKGMKREEQETLDAGFATVKESTYNGKIKQIKITDDVIISQAIIFFFAGFDTVSTAMSFGAYELAVNKDVQDKLREEIRETCKKINGKVTYESLLKMTYLDMVISEILRKWPGAAAIDRICTKPYTIEPVSSNEKPLYLNVGDSIWVPVYPLHRDPDYYPNPEKFDPERFSDENKDNIKPYTYLPFGSGPRNCIGSRFALLEIKALFFNLLLNFEITPCGKTQIPLKLAKIPRQLAAEKGFWFSFKRIRN